MTMNSQANALFRLKIGIDDLSRLALVTALIYATAAHAERLTQESNLDIVLRVKGHIRE